MLADAEMALLLASARSHPAAPDITDALSRPIHWDRFLSLARSHHVVPLVQKSIGHLVPDDVNQQLRGLLNVQARRAMFLVAELVKLIELLDSHGITAVPFKGSVLAMQAYGNLALRQCGDLDLLVRRRDVRKAKELLIARGHELIFPNSSPREAAFLASMDQAAEANYLRWHCEYHLIRPADHLNIDLHWRINPPEMSLPFDEDALFGRLEPMNLAGRRIMRMSAADTLLVLCFNGGKDCWKRLDRICDVAELLRSHPSLDLSAALDAARRIGAQRMLLLGLALAHDLLGAPLPEWIPRDATIRALVPIVRRGLVESLDMPEMQWQLESALFHLRLRERVSDRIRYCAARLTPTVGDWTSLTLPPRLAFLYYVVRPLRLAGKLCTMPVARVFNPCAQQHGLQTHAATMPHLNEPRLT